jgi:hypothetical protein
MSKPILTQVAMPHLAHGQGMPANALSSTTQGMKEEVRNGFALGTNVTTVPEGRSVTSRGARSRQAAATPPESMSSAVGQKQHSRARAVPDWPIHCVAQESSARRRATRVRHAERTARGNAGRRIGATAIKGVTEKPSGSSRILEDAGNWKGYTAEDRPQEAGEEVIEGVCSAVTQTLPPCFAPLPIPAGYLC